jgi:hypothetical protein
VVATDIVILIVDDVTVMAPTVTFALATTDTAPGETKIKSLGAVSIKVLGPWLLNPVFTVSETVILDRVVVDPTQIVTGLAGVTEVWEKAGEKERRVETAKKTRNTSGRNVNNIEDTPNQKLNIYQASKVTISLQKALNRKIAHPCSLL